MKASFGCFFVFAGHVRPWVARITARRAFAIVSH
jgi:hypothetical protein